MGPNVRTVEGPFDHTPRRASPLRRSLGWAPQRLPRGQWRQRLTCGEGRYNRRPRCVPSYLSVGLPGISAALGRHGSLSTYSDLGGERRDRLPPDLWASYGADWIGAIVIDKAVVGCDVYSGAIRGPLCDPTLPAGARDTFRGIIEGPLGAGARHMLAAMMGEPGNAYGSLAAMALASEGSTDPGPLDRVSLVEYLCYWRGKGARIGRVRDDGTIRWDPSFDGERWEHQERRAA